MVIISGPSGAGKSTVVKRLIERCHLPLELSISATTRAPRDGEINGRDYHFLSQEEFARCREAGEFLECMEVYGRGDWYGTLAGTVSTGLEEGKWVILEIDVQGAISVVERFPSANTIFIDPGSLEELERRLRNRGTESEEAIARRLEVARGELKDAHRYRHTVINQDPDQAADEICRILQTRGESDECTTN